MRAHVLTLTLGLLTLAPIQAWAATERATDPAARTIDLTVEVEADAATLYRVFATTDGVLALFPGADARIGDAVGGEYLVAFDPSHPDGTVNGTAGCRILALEPEHRVAFQWRGTETMTAMNAEPLATWVEVELAPLETPPNEGDRTAIRLRHHGFGPADADETAETAASWDLSFQYFSGAWARVLDRLVQRYAALPDLGERAASETLYVFLLRPGPAWSAEKTLHEQPKLFNHAAYLGDLARQGIMVVGGPFADLADSARGDLILALGALRVPDAAVARRYLDADPAVRAGTFVYELRPWPVTLPGEDG